MKIYNMIIPAKDCHVHAQSNIRYLARLTIMGGIVVSCDSGVIKFQKEVGREVIGRSERGGQE